MRNIQSFVLYSFYYASECARGPDPCGPANILDEEFSKNVAKDSRCFELRFYTADPAVNGKGGVDDLHQRFRERQIKLLEEHGADMVAHWQRLDNPNTVVWLLAFEIERTEMKSLPVLELIRSGLPCGKSTVCQSIGN